MQIEVSRLANDPFVAPAFVGKCASRFNVTMQKCEIVVHYAVFSIQRLDKAKLNFCHSFSELYQMFSIFNCSQSYILVTFLWKLFINF